MKLAFQSLFQPTILLAIALMAVIVMMILPVPAWVLDIGLAASFALAILIFTVTLFIERPLDFSSFPTVLLASLILRLSLNVSSTKLIIGEGHTGVHAAGGVIQGFANFVMGGSVFLGLVVFGVLLIVNFMVITKGAARMAEVGARFALDAMPGKQLAIDADMSAGAIGHTEASERRQGEQLETTFFGSLDGASKFVKGDAIAGLLITLLNLVVGLMMGVIAHEMPLPVAFETYAILTVGDGLVTQIPAVIISIASALLLARGGSSGATDLALFDQLGKYPAALATVAVMMVMFAMVPGLPFIPFVLGGVALGGLAVMGLRSRKEETSPSSEPEEPVFPLERPLGDLLSLDDIHVEFATDLVDLALDPATGLDARISNMRAHVATKYGLVLPEIRLTDDPGLSAGTYILKIHGVEYARAKLVPEKILALAPDNSDNLPVGEDVTEPVYGAPARWVGTDQQEQIALSGITFVTPVEVLSTHLLEMVKKNLGRLLTLKSLRRLLEEMVNVSDPDRATANRKFLDDLIPDKVPLETLHSVLRLLLEEQVSIRNLPLILETISEGRHRFSQLNMLCEFVRQRLGFQLVADMRRQDGTIPLIQLAPEWEETFTTYQVESDQGGLDVALPPDVFNTLIGSISERIDDANQHGIFPALVTSSHRRRFLQKITRAKNISNPVLSFDEIGLEARPSLVAMVPA